MPFTRKADTGQKLTYIVLALHYVPPAIKKCFCELVPSIAARRIVKWIMEPRLFLHFPKITKSCIELNYPRNHLQQSVGDS